MTNYEVRIIDVVSFDMNLNSREMFRGQIVRIDSGAEAYATKCYSDKRTARLQAARYVKNYEHHLAKHGIGWEEQQAQKKAAERAARDAKREADRKVRDAAHDMLAALEEIAFRAERHGMNTDEARAAIAKAKGE
jgi:hypothetical protein